MIIQMNQMLSTRISDISKFQNFFVKNEKKIDNYSLNYHKRMVQPLILRILMFLFLKIPMLKISHLGGCIYPICRNIVLTTNIKFFACQIFGN